MAADPLEEKINKIRQQNEEIRRRYEEVEADKKNAAKSNALVQMVPSTDWPERKEPPEFSSPPQPPKTPPKPRNSPRDNNGSIQYRAGGEGKKSHSFPQNEGPPPDPKYNFLADSEREERYENFSREVDKPKAREKPSRPHFKRQRSGREWQSREYRGKSGNSGQDSLPDYEAWRAERNKIDEARINRQRTAEGNWKREWDNDKMHLADDITRRETHTLGDAMRYPRNSSYSHGRESDHERRIISSTEKNSQVNHISSATKNPLMSVKVSSTNIVGTGRVGPRQRNRMMYSSQSEKDSMNFEVGNFTVQKSPEDKSKSSNFQNPKGFHSQRRNDSDKSPHALRREHERSDKSHKNDVKSSSLNNKDFRNFQKSPHVQRRNIPMNYQAKSPRNVRKIGKGVEESVAFEVNGLTSGVEIASEGRREEYSVGGTINPSHEDDSSIVERNVVIEVVKEVVETVGSQEPPSLHDNMNNIKNNVDALENSQMTIKDDREIREDEDKIKINFQEQKSGVGLPPDDNPEVIDDNSIEVIDKAILNLRVDTSEDVKDEISAPQAEQNHQDDSKK